MLLHEDRLFPAEPATRKIARALYAQVRSLPILSPHGHTQAAWFAANQPFPDPATLLVQPDHYIYRMLYSQGISLEDLEIGQPRINNPRQVWSIFASNYYLFRGTPTRMWLDFVFQNLFGLQERLTAKTADLYFDTISEKLLTPAFLPRALYEKINNSQPPTRRWIRSTRSRPSANRAGRRAFCPHSAPTPWLILSFLALPRTLSAWASRPAKTPRRGPAI
jgi:glucuronate isomerase